MQVELAFTSGDDACFSPATFFWWGWENWNDYAIIVHVNRGLLQKQIEIGVE